MCNNTNMKLRSYLNVIFSEKKINILRYFYMYPKGSYTGREIARNLNQNNKTCITLLTCLCDVGLLKKDIIGKSHAFSINDSFIWKDLNLLFENETTLFEKIKTNIYSVFNKYCTSIIIFGSYAESNETVDSDLDICFIYKKEFEDKVKELCDSYTDSFYTQYQCHLNPYIIDQASFKKSNLTLIKEIKEKGIEING